MSTKPEDLPSSRDIKDCHPELQKRWAWIVHMYAALWPGDPLPSISSTFRSMADQNKMRGEGNSKLSWPNGTHNNTRAELALQQTLSSSSSQYPTPTNYFPYSLALDFFFTINGETAYPPGWMERVINLSALVGLFSGKAWGWDLPHLALVEKKEMFTGSTVLELPPVPALPGRSVRAQPIIKYYDRGTPITHRGRGDVLIRVQTTEGDDGVVVHARYDELDDGR